ncbi:MAG: hypothetical protein P4L40_10755 [Terracidiphilus sp.]|nr:hypothetical protein [Terracidiphilus sp.]
MIDFRTAIRSEFIPTLVAAGFLLLAASSHWPYAFYALLRVAVCAVGLYMAYSSFSARRTLWVWLCGIVAVVFNPILPMRMHRSDWSILNIVAAGIFILWIVASIVRENKKLD